MTFIDLLDGHSAQLVQLLSVSCTEITSKLKPFFDKFEISDVLAKHAPGGRTPGVGNNSFSFKMVMAAARSATHVAP